MYVETEKVSGTDFNEALPRNTKIIIDNSKVSFAVEKLRGVLEKDVLITKKRLFKGPPNLVSAWR